MRGVRNRSRARQMDRSVVIFSRTFRRVCGIQSRIGTRQCGPIDAARYISRWMRNSIYKSAYGNGETKSRSGFRILISCALHSRRNAFYYFRREFSCQHCGIHMFRFAWCPRNVTITYKTKIFILRSCVSISYIVSYIAYIICFLYYNSKRREI